MPTGTDTIKVITKHLRMHLLQHSSPKSRNALFTSHSPRRQVRQARKIQHTNRQSHHHQIPHQSMKPCWWPPVPQQMSRRSSLNANQPTNQPTTTQRPHPHCLPHPLQYYGLSSRIQARHPICQCPRYRPHRHNAHRTQSSSTTDFHADWQLHSSRLCQQPYHQKETIKSNRYQGP